jgi:hypothetical protein
VPVRRPRSAAARRSLIDAIDRPGNLEAIEAFDLERGDYQSTVREHVGVSEVGVRVGEVAGIRRGKAAAVEAKDYHSAATARRLERELLEDARTRLTIELPDTGARAQRLIDAARADLA